MCLCGHTLSVLPAHELGPSFRCVFNFFYHFVVSVYTIFTSLVNFIPMMFTLFRVIVNGIFP